MSFSRVYSAQTNALKGAIVTIEVDITKNSMHAFTVVGLPDKAVDESKDRVSGALKNSNYTSPKTQNQKVVISLSPADLKKEGPYFDLGIALGYLLSLGDIEFDTEGKIFLGELALNGELKSIKGTLPLVREAKARGFKEIYLPIENVIEAGLIEGIDIYGAKTLREVIEHLDLRKQKSLDKLGTTTNAVGKKLKKQGKTEVIYETPEYVLDIADIRGQESAKRGLEIAAAGGHNIIMSGPPGTGKTMLAKAFAGIMPKLTLNEILEITGIYSVGGLLHNNSLITTAPFRSPHHTASYVSIVGGGTFPKPGEVTLAHLGVLFLDEFPEFEKRVIESLRQPLEDKVVTVSRSKGSVVFPSQFILVAAMNPCPCGNRGSKKKECICSPHDLARYARKLSAPILDRIDISVKVEEVEYEKLGSNVQEGDTTKNLRERVERARAIARKRFKLHPRKISTNTEMNTRDLNEYAPLGEEERKILHQSAERLGLSARAYHRVIKLARTIADLSQSEQIKTPHILEALQYRPKS